MFPLIDIKTICLEIVDLKVSKAPAETFVFEYSRKFIIFGMEILLCWSDLLIFLCFVIVDIRFPNVKKSCTYTSQNTNKYFDFLRGNKHTLSLVDSRKPSVSHTFANYWLEK